MPMQPARGTKPGMEHGQYEEQDIADNKEK